MKERTRQLVLKEISKLEDAISSQSLLKGMGYELEYPDYRGGTYRFYADKVVNGYQVGATVDRYTSGVSDALISVYNTTTKESVIKKTYNS